MVHDKQLDDDGVEVRMLHQRKILEVVKMNTAAAQTRQKEQYDRKHYNPDVFYCYEKASQKNITLHSPSSYYDGRTMQYDRAKLFLIRSRPSTPSCVNSVRSVSCMVLIFFKII